jgi:hypothetical protein
MGHVYLALIETSEDGTGTGSRLLGRIADPDVVQVVRERLAARMRSEIDRLHPQDVPGTDSKSGH